MAATGTSLVSSFANGAPSRSSILSDHSGPSPSRGLFGGQAVAVAGIDVAFKNVSALRESISARAQQTNYNSSLPGGSHRESQKHLMLPHYVSELVLCSLVGMIKDRTAYYDNWCLYLGDTHKESSRYLLFVTDDRRNKHTLM